MPVPPDKIEIRFPVTNVIACSLLDTCRYNLAGPPGTTGFGISFDSQNGDWVVAARSSEEETVWRAYFFPNLEE